MGKTGVRGTFAALVAAALCGCGSEPDFVTVDGTMLGTTLHVVADVKGVSRQRLYAAVMELDREAKASMSIYDSTSLVSRLNRNETDSVDRHIAFNLHLADSIGALSDGRYDVTVKPLVEAWGFAGRERAENPNVDSILEFVGREKVRVEGGRLVKDDPRVQLDFNSVAKGYTVDLLAGLVEKYGAENYIVDIGGEVRCRGLNRQGRAWRIGVETPFDGNMSDGEYLQKRIQMTGGDGTVNYAVNAMKRKGLDIPIGVIPAGTANDFAGAVGMSREPLEAARQIASGAVDRVDIGRVNDLYFVNIFSFGIFTTTSQRTPDERKHKIGKLAYIIEGVKEFRTMHAVPLEIEADGERFDLRSLMVLIFNGETAGGFHLARRSSIKDGLFDCILLEKKNFFRSTLAMCRYLAGGSPKIVRHLRARRIDIRSSVNEPTDVDGQKGAEFPLHIECLAGGLRVMCAKQASGNF